MATTPKNDAAAEAPAAEAVEAPKPIHVGAVVSPELYDKLEEYRWQNRLTKSQVIVAAIEFFCSNKLG